MSGYNYQHPPKAGNFLLPIASLLDKNLYLKYLWCIDIICEPPHCPIDKIILNKLKDYKTSWTKMNKDDYIRAIKKINFVRGKESIAQWELREFSRR